MSGATEPLLEAVAMVRVPVLLSVATAARLLDCSPRTVRRRIAERVLPAVVEHGRVMVRGDELRAYIDGLERVGPRPPRRGRARGAELRLPAQVRGRLRRAGGVNVGAYWWARRMASGAQRMRHKPAC